MALKLSREELYGLMALVDLSQASQNSRVKSIAERNQIPTRFLEQIFNKFRQANLVIGKRGPTGGYTLARPAQEITLRSVMIALKPTTTVAKKEKAPITEGLINTVTNFWSEVEDRFNQSLSDVSLASLRDRAVEVSSIIENEEDSTSDFSLNVS